MDFPRSQTSTSLKQCGIILMENGSPYPMSSFKCPSRSLESYAGRLLLRESVQTLLLALACTLIPFMFTRLNKLLYLLHIFLVVVQDFVQCCCDFFLLTFLLALLLSALLLVLSSSSKSSSLCIMAWSTNRSKHTHIHSMTGFKHQLTKWWRIVYNRSVYLWWLLIFPPVWWVMGSILSLHLLLSRTV